MMFKRIWVLLIGGLLFLILTASASADVGPKPTMTFEFVFEGEPIAILDGQLIECEEATCAEGRPLEEVGPQYFGCTATSCTSQSYGYRPYHKLIIEFEDRTRESNIFAGRSFDDNFRVTVRQNDLQVTPTSWSLGKLGLALVITLIVETVVAGLYLLVFKLPRLVLFWVPLASLLSLPVVWLVFPKLLFPAGLVMCLYELFAVVFEAAFLYFTNRRRGISPVHATVLSLLMNFASFLFTFFVIG